MKKYGIPDPEDSWATVELYRWQTGELPFGDGEKLNESKALKRMAEILINGPESEIPPPYNVGMVLKYISKKHENN